MKRKMIECSAYKEEVRTFYRYTFIHEGKKFDRVKECVGPLSKGEFLACIEAIEEAKKVGFKPDAIQVTSKAVYVNFKNPVTLAKTSELFKAACVLKLLVEETGVRVLLKETH